MAFHSNRAPHSAHRPTGLPGPGGLIKYGLSPHTMAAYTSAWSRPMPCSRNTLACLAGSRVQEIFREM